MNLPDAYLTDAEAEEIAARLADASAWSSSTAEARAAALIQASDEIDTLRFAGRKYDPDQARQFPRLIERDPATWPASTRAGSVNADVWDVDDDGSAVVPDLVKVAAFLQARHILASPRRMSRLEDQAAGVASQSAGGFSETYRPRPDAAAHLVCLQARKALGAYLLKGGRPI